MTEYSKNGKKPEPEKKEKRKVQLISQIYYGRKDIQKAMFEFCKHRETIASFNYEYFAKRPDCFDYPNDILLAAKKGATSFHCSEELWVNPLNIKTDMTKEQYNEIKIGWDFLIDIDSKYLDYSKIAATLLIEELEKHGVKNYGIKFSGSKGFHILVPFASFPKTFSDEVTKDKFPEWPRAIAQYLFERIKGPMNHKIMQLTNIDTLKEKGELMSEYRCPTCGSAAQKKMIGVYNCPNFSCRAQVKSMKSNRKEMLCPSCNGTMQRTGEEEVVFCDACGTNSAVIEANKIDREMSATSFTQEVTTKSAEDAVDLVLVAQRHLFRAPYSLHEKTALASIVLDKSEIEDFTPSDADPLKIHNPKSFMPNPLPGEAKDLLFEALDNVKEETRERKKYDGAPLDLKGLTITEDMFPPIIKKLQKGIQGDGRKRALYILLSFYNALEFPQEFIEEKIFAWNKKNKLPLKEGYVVSQVSWFSKRKILPPNYTNPMYKVFGTSGKEESGIKNPITYTIKKAMRGKAKEGMKNENKPDNLF